MSKLKNTAVVPLLVLVFLSITASAFLAYTLIARGIGESRPSWIALGAIAGLVWLGAMKIAVSRRRPAAAATETDEPSP